MASRCVGCQNRDAAIADLTKEVERLREADALSYRIIDKLRADNHGLTPDWLIDMGGQDHFAETEKALAPRIRDLESQLSEKEQEVERLRLSEHVELDLMNAGAVGLAKQLLDDDGKGEMSPGPCADALALVRKLKTEKRKLARLVEAAKKVRHWHDTHDGGMVVSGESVRGLWEAIKEATGEGK